MESSIFRHWIIKVWYLTYHLSPKNLKIWKIWNLVISELPSHNSDPESLCYVAGNWHVIKKLFDMCRINRIIPYIKFLRLALIDSKIGEIWWNYVVNNSIITKNCQSRSVIRNCLIQSKNVWLLLSTCQEVLSSHEVLIIMSHFLEFVYRIFFSE